MDLTRDKLCSLIKKWQTLIEAQVDVRTTDGYLLRIVSTCIIKERKGSRGAVVSRFEALGAGFDFVTFKVERGWKIVVPASAP